MHEFFNHLIIKISFIVIVSKFKNLLIFYATNTVTIFLFLIS